MSRGFVNRVNGVFAIVPLKLWRSLNLLFFFGVSLCRSRVHSASFVWSGFVDCLGQSRNSWMEVGYVFLRRSDLRSCSHRYLWGCHIVYMTEKLACPLFRVNICEPVSLILGFCLCNYLFLWWRGSCGTGWVCSGDKCFTPVCALFNIIVGRCHLFVGRPISKISKCPFCVWLWTLLLYTGF